MNAHRIDARRRDNTYLQPLLGSDKLKHLSLLEAASYLKRTKTAVVSDRFRVVGARNAVVPFLRAALLREAAGEKDKDELELDIQASLSRDFKEIALFKTTKRPVSPKKTSAQKKPGAPKRLPPLPETATPAERRAYVEGILRSLGQATPGQIEELAHTQTADAHYIRYTLERGVRGGTIKRRGPEGLLYSLGQPADTTRDAYGETLFREAVGNIQSPFTVKQLAAFIKKRYDFPESLPDLQKTVDSAVFMLTLEHSTPATYSFIVY